MVAGVPEPGAGLLLLVGSLLTVTGLSHRNQRRGASSMNYSRRILMIAAFVAVIAAAFSAERAAAQTTVRPLDVRHRRTSPSGANGITAAARHHHDPQRDDAVRRDRRNWRWHSAD